MTTELNRFLTPLDATFLYVERPGQPMHIGGCMVYEGEFSREYVMRQVEAHLHQLPRYRQRVLFPPFMVSHPVWVDDPSFDIANHVDEMHLPEHADHRTLAGAAAEAYGGMLDRKRPLWHGTVLRGIPGHTAVVWKVHHAMVDGVSGVDLTMALSNFSPDETPPKPPASPWAPAPLPGAMNLLQEAVQHRLGEVNDAWTNAAFDAMRPGFLTERMREMTTAGGVSLPSASPAPRTPFNRPVSGEQSVAWAQFSFTELRAVKSALGGTVNDVVLTVLAGGIGRYLRAHDHKTSGVELRALCPVSMRQQDQRGQLGNLVSGMIAPLFVGVEDPVERLGREREAMNQLKKAGQAKALHQMSRLSDGVPPLMTAIAATMPFSQTVLNTVSTNVPGPMIPLWFGPHKLVDWLPFGIVSNNIGLFVGILSYNHRITLGMTVDSRLVPDSWLLAECLEESWVELADAAGVEREAPTGALCFADARAGEGAPVAPNRSARSRSVRQQAGVEASDHETEDESEVAGTEVIAESEAEQPQPVPDSESDAESEVEAEADSRQQGAA